MLCFFVYSFYSSLNLTPHIFAPPLPDTLHSYSLTPFSTLFVLFFRQPSPLPFFHPPFLLPNLHPSIYLFLPPPSTPSPSPLPSFPSGSESPCHQDPFHNILCQVYGTKHVLLFPPEQHVRSNERMLDCSYHHVVMIY